MSPVGFEPTISAGERPQTYALDRAATGTGISTVLLTSNRVVRGRTELQGAKIVVNFLSLSRQELDVTSKSLTTGSYHILSPSFIVILTSRVMSRMWVTEC